MPSARWGLIASRPGSEQNWVLVTLESVSAKVCIRGFVAQVHAKMMYCNTTNDVIQVHAVLPVEEGAAVYYCEAHLDGRTIVTHCMEKKKAQKMYDEAVAAGKTAVLAREHQDTSDILRISLGNLPAGTKAEVILKLVMELKIQSDGGVNFILPTVLNPRYGPSNHTMDEVSNSWLSQSSHERVVSVSQRYFMEVKGEVTGSHRIARVTSHTDPIRVTLADDEMSAQVIGEEGFNCDHDWSLLVYYANPYQPHLLREIGDPTATGLMKDDLLMLNFFPEIRKDTFSNANEIIFVIDRSGSMRGTNMENARATLLLFLKSLPPGCLFNIVSFGSHFSLLFPEGSRKYTEETLMEACSLYTEMNADMGGTEILLPLKHIYSKPCIPGYSRQILLITDGEVWNVDEVVGVVSRQAHHTRLFSVGVGHGASSALVHGVARAGRGRSELVLKQGLLQEKVMSLVGSMVQESVQEVSISCEVEVAGTVKLIPKVPPVIFGGQHVILYTRVPSSIQVKSVTVQGRLGSERILDKFEGHRFTAVHDEAKSLHRMAARAQILQWQMDEEEDVAEEMVSLSVASGVVSRRTALVGIDMESGKPLKAYAPLNLVESTNVNTMYGSVPRHRCCFASAPVFGSLNLSDTHLQSTIVSDTSQFQLRSANKSQSRRLARLCSGIKSDPLQYNSPNSMEAGGSGEQQHQTHSGLMEVVALQQFDGSWNFEAAAKLLNMVAEALRLTNPTKDEVSWSTALVVVLLETRFGSQQEQWALLVTKARAFLAARGHQVEELLAKARCGYPST